MSDDIEAMTEEQKAKADLIQAVCVAYIMTPEPPRGKGMSDLVKLAVSLFDEHVKPRAKP